MASAASRTMACSSCKPAQTTASSSPNLLTPFDAGGDLDAPLVTTPAPAGPCPHPKERPAGCAGDRGDRGWAFAHSHAGDLKVIMHQPPFNDAYNAPYINMNGVKCEPWIPPIWVAPSLAASKLTMMWSPPQHQTQGVQSGHPGNSVVRNGDQNGVEAQPVQLQLPSVGTTDEMAEPDPGHGRAGSGRNP
nr:unnamed protein product [Spirometra erinaceieuropaei]